MDRRSIIPLLCSLFLGAAQAQNDSTQLYVVQGIIVTGNEVTKEQVIHRELVINEGDILKRDELYELIKRSEENLFNTRLFNSVTAIPVFINKREVFVQIQVNERWYVWPVPLFELAETNFNTWWLTKDFRRTNYGGYLDWANFRGLNERLYLKLRFGYSRQFALQYKKPFFDRAQKFGLDAGVSYFQQHEITIGTAENKRIFYSPPDGNSREEWKGEVGFTLRRSYDLRHRWFVRYTEATVLDTVVRAAPDYFGSRTDLSRFFSLGYQVSQDERDNKNFAQQGRYLGLAIEQNGLLIMPRAPNITTALVKGTQWFDLPANMVFATSASYKHSLGGHIPYYLQSALGYDRYVRGYEFYVIDGQRSALFRQNLTYPIVKPMEHYIKPIPIEAFRTFQFALYANLFFDAGYVWDRQYDEQNFLANKWMRGYGIGLDIVTSYDLVFRGEYTLNDLGEHGFFLHFTNPF